ncbi:MAG: double-cubane-cluster-containing anaerobic reductase [Pseudomonadota bacterium]
MAPLTNWKYFETLGEKTLLALERRGDLGLKTVGVYCIFSPVEIIQAAGAVAVGLCGKSQVPIGPAETVLPANLCPLIKSSYGFALTDTCPWFAAADFLVGETTCDGKKKMYELLGRLKPMYVMHLPHSGEESRTLDFWTDELRRLADFLGGQTGLTVRDDVLAEQIAFHNRLRRAFKKMADLFKADAPPLSGMDFLAIVATKGFCLENEDYFDRLEGLQRELALRVETGEAVASPEAPRILLTGCPIGRGSDKVLRLIEAGGGIVAALENCSGLKALEFPVDETEADPYRALAKRYLKSPCSCLSPNPGRLEFLDRLVRDFRVEGIVDLTWHSCHTYAIESYLIRERAEKNWGLPVLRLETDYSTADLGQLRTRIEAFLEIIAGSDRTLRPIQGFSSAS